MGFLLDLFQFVTLFSGQWVKKQAETTFFPESPKGTMIKERANGDTMYYNPVTNTFIVKNADGNPKTMFRPQNEILGKTKMTIENLYPCPCCANGTISELGNYEICPVCGWEDDLVQSEDPYFSGGANLSNLNDAKKKYFEKLSCAG